MNADRLPPHDEPAERGVLGCVLQAPAEWLPVVRAKFGTDEVFYDLRHQTLWHTLTYLHAAGTSVDIITVQAELTNRGQLDQIGGIGYLLELERDNPSAANLPAYLAIVWEKFIFRTRLAINAEQSAVIYDNNGAAESYVARVDAQHQAWKALLQRGLPTPKNLKAPGEFGEAYYNQWFNRHEDTFGYALPFEFPLRYRPKATTLMTGDNGSGKSSMLCLTSVIVAKQLDVAAGEKVVVASMEMPPEVTLWIMGRQLLGLGKLECTDENIAKTVRALAWLNQRVLVYDFLGITDRHELLNTFHYAAEHQHGKFFIIDNMMKVGIADDDYAAQGQFIQAVCDFDIRRNAHTIVVVHENKGDGNAKQKVRGTKQLTDAPDNVVGMKRNEAKGEKLEEFKAELKAGQISREVYDGKVRGIATTWDSKFMLSKQRWPGSQQNGSRWLYFDKTSLQFHEEPNQRAFDYTMD